MRNLIPLLAFAVLAGCRTIPLHYDEVRPGQTPEQVQGLLGEPGDRRSEGNHEAWQYCVVATLSDDFFAVVFEDGVVARTQRYKTAGLVGGPCGGYKDVLAARPESPRPAQDSRAARREAARAAREAALSELDAPPAAPAPTLAAPQPAPTAPAPLPADRKGVKEGLVSVGMSKQGVLTAYGIPARHKTPSLDETVWFYWKNRFRTKAIGFDEQGLVREIKD
ncbi:MAG: hypothetical protein A2X36_01070 [Elusimicrobia bacterium GWA2_69_24]|nr:MAG: hypothetical protein A2X36_01070 [Elusimicrobia bacterium GWA2_69_24]